MFCHPPLAAALNAVGLLYNTSRNPPAGLAGAPFVIAANMHETKQPTVYNDENWASKDQQMHCRVT